MEDKTMREAEARLTWRLVQEKFDEIKGLEREVVYSILHMLDETAEMEGVKQINENPQCMEVSFSTFSTARAWSASHFMSKKQVAEIAQKIYDAESIKLIPQVLQKILSTGRIRTKSHGDIVINPKVREKLEEILLLLEPETKVAQRRYCTPLTCTKGYSHCCTDCIEYVLCKEDKCGMFQVTKCHAARKE